MAAASRIMTDEDKILIANRIKAQHAALAKLTDMFNANKKALETYSRNQFVNDIGHQIPEYNGNHEYHTTKGTVTVNFKVTGRAPVTINGKPAAEIIREKFGEETDRLFVLKDDIKVLASDEDLRTQIADHPEVFAVALKPITHKQMMALVTRYPDCMQVMVTDLEKYATLYPDSVTKTPVAGFKPGFIENLGKLSEVLKKSVRGLVKAFLPDVLQAVVTCGPTSKK